MSVMLSPDKNGISARVSLNWPFLLGMEKYFVKRRIIYFRPNKKKTSNTFSFLPYMGVG